MTVHVPGAFGLRGRGRIGDPATGSVRLGGKHSPLPDYDLVTDEGVSPLRGIPRGRVKTRLEGIAGIWTPPLSKCKYIPGMSCQDPQDTLLSPHKYSSNCCYT